jgi:hypothetical protein
VAFVFISLMIAAGYVVLWYYWQGRNWARILVFLTCFLCFYNLRSFLTSNLLVRIMLVGHHPRSERHFGWSHVESRIQGAAT